MRSDSSLEMGLVPGEDSEATLEEHPSLEELSSYHKGILTPSSVDRIQEHLILCSDCLDLFLDLAVFLDTEAPALTNDEFEDAWNLLNSKLRETTSRDSFSSQRRSKRP